MGKLTPGRYWGNLATMESRIGHVKGPHPQVLALLACDKVIVAQGTGGITLVDIFSGVASPEFPAVLPRMCVYVLLENGEDNANPVYLGLFSSDGELLAGTMVATAGRESVMVETHCVFPSVKIDRPGSYDLQLVTSGIVLARRTMLFQILPSPPEVQDD